MHAWDREREIHNPELYAVWNGKPWLLNQALLHLQTDSNAYDYAFWSDAGSFRDAHAFGAWPDPERVKEVFAAASRRRSQPEASRDGYMVFFPLMKPPGMGEHNWRVEKGPIDIDFSEGSFFGSTPSGIAWLAAAFYAIHDHYINTTPPPQDQHHPHAPATTPGTSRSPPFHFVGKDQTLFNTLMFRHPARFFGVVSPVRAGQLPPSSGVAWISTLARTPPIPTIRVLLAKLVYKVKLYLGERCVDDWYYYQWWLASPEGRRRTEKMRGWRRWRLGMLGGGEECTETGIVRVQWLLESIFGSRWVDNRMAKSNDPF
ncbi:hypothetical protein H0H81_007125 [Sphagnurus paluster]|uniref:Uncharacterized protein n=1 Tax=Sphagnurus paluster TaxID=117069 RepID=A0A9P7FTC2_9AGAR|nr:hypothetical protein H0H81_007125 [Sphagnurus paluster]